MLAALAFCCCSQISKDTALAVSSSDSGFSFEKNGGTRYLRIVSGRDWYVRSQPDWLVLDLLKGNGSSSPRTVSMQVNPNSGMPRTGEIVFSDNLTQVTISVTQQGGDVAPDKEDGTLENPYIVSEYISAGKPIGKTDIFIRGVIDEVKTGFEAGLGVASFYLADDLGWDVRLTCSKCLYLGNIPWVSGQTDIKKGDNIILCIRTDGSAYIYSLNGKIEDGGAEDPTDYDSAPSLTISAFIAAAKTDSYFKLTGVVSSFDTKSFEMTLTDATGSIYVYNVLNHSEWEGLIYDNGIITLSGKYHYYAGKRISEVIDAHIISFSPAGSINEPISVTVAGFRAAAVSETQSYRLHGRISRLENNVYGNFDLTDDTGTVFVYGLTATNLGFGNSNDKSFASLRLAEGDEIIIIGFRADYNGQTEAKYSYFVEKTGSLPPQQDEPVTPTGELEGEPTVTVDFRKPFADLPQSNNTGINDGVYVWSGYTFTVHAADRFYQGQTSNVYYLLLGKQYSYIQLPVISGKALYGIRFHTAPQASENVILDIGKVGGDRLTVNDSKLKKDTEYEWVIPGEPGVAYELLVANAYNAQIQYFSLYYK